MRSSLTLLSLCSLASAFNITQPLAGAKFHATSNITVAWTTSPKDPALVNLYLGNAETSGDSKLIAANVSTSSGRYVIAANTLNVTEAATNYTIIADSTGSEGNALEGESGVFEIEANTATGTASASASASAASASATSSSVAAGDVGVQSSQWALLACLLAVALTAR